MMKEQILLQHIVINKKTP